MPHQETYRSVWSAQYGAQVATIPPRAGPRNVRRITILGPDSSKFGLYSGAVPIDLYLMSTTNVGSRNTASYAVAVVIPANTLCVGAWTGGLTGPATVGQLTIEWDPP